jgi:hypothetical protein
VGFTQSALALEPEPYSPHTLSVVVVGMAACFAHGGNAGEAVLWLCGRIIDKSVIGPMGYEQLYTQSSYWSLEHKSEHLIIPR